jgi:hypothetical protein
LIGEHIIPLTLIHLRKAHLQIAGMGILDPIQDVIEVMVVDVEGCVVAATDRLHLQDRHMVVTKHT